MNLYYLLIGINDYAGNPLTQCVGDVEKMDAYLQSLQPQFAHIFPKILLDQDATRAKVIDEIQQFIGTATDDDVALIYYSGHGAQEETAGRFPDEQDGLLECIVCYNKDEISTAQLLADKEIRYLFSKLKHNPHLITIFDCCHSGDIVRAFVQADQGEERVRRITDAFPARADEDFVFATDAVTVKMLQEGTGTSAVSFKNHVNLSACLSSESSWEDAKGGVFTRYLIELLKKTDGQLTYADIARWAKISLKSITRKQQTPVVTVQGIGKWDAQISWLNLHPEGVHFPESFISNNQKQGWVFSRGSLLGVQPGMDVTMTLSAENKVTVKVKEAALDHAIVELPDEVLMNMDFKKQYAASTTLSTFSELKLHLNEIDAYAEVAEKIKTLLSGFENVKLVDAGDADFYINTFNQFIYFSLPEHDFQPLAKQITITRDITLPFKDQLNAFIKWHHFLALENPSKDFDKCPIRVTASFNGTETDVTNGKFIVDPQPDRNNKNELQQDIILTVENTSKSKLYVTALVMSSDLSIQADPFYEMSVELNRGEKQTFYYEDQKKVFINFDKYKEIYNWKEEWFYYKFIFNNDDSIGASIPDFLQDALEHPITLPYAALMGAGGHPADQGVKRKWGTALTRIELTNSNYNIPCDELLDENNHYADDVKLAPFIKELYSEQEYGKKGIEIKLKQNKTDSADQANARASNSFIVQFMNKIYGTARKRKFLHQQQVNGPVVIAEGDSWFLYPKPGVRDTLDYIMEKYHLLSLARAGDEIADYLKKKDLIEAVEKYKPKYVLISGGGNDILGEEVKDILKKNVQNGQLGTDFIEQSEFEKKLKTLEEGYIFFIEEVRRLQPDVIVLVHGYDYVRSNPDAKTIKNGWANRYMIEYQIKDAELRKKVIYYLVDSFNDLLKKLAGKYPYVMYIDNRGQVGENEWMDEIHPNNIGFQKVANNFLTSMS